MWGLLPRRGALTWVPSLQLAGGRPASFAPRGARAGCAVAPRPQTCRPCLTPLLCVAPGPPDLIRQGSAPTAQPWLEPRPGTGPAARLAGPLPSPRGASSHQWAHYLYVLLMTCVSLGPKPSVQRPRNPFCVDGSAQGRENQLGDALDRNW